MSNNINTTVGIDLNSESAQQKVERLTAEAKALKKEITQLSKDPVLNAPLIKQANKELAQTRAELRNVKKDTIDVKKVMDNLSGATLNQLEAALRKVTKEMKSVGRNTDEFQKLQVSQKMLKAEIDKTNGSLKQQEGFMSRLANNFSKYSGIVMGAMASMTGISLALNKAITYANDREEGMNYLQSLTGLTPEAVAEMEQMAIKASTSVIDGNVRIRQSADDIVAAYTVVGSQRPELLKNSQALHAVTQDAIILSEAAKMDLDPATRALTNTLNQFTLSADQSRRVINILAAGSQAGSADIEYLSEAIEKVGTTANLMGISVETTVGAIEAIGPFYAEASMAGNSFDKVLLKLKANQIGYKDGVFDLNTAILEMEQRFANGESAVDLFGVEHAKMAELLVQNRDQILTYTDAVTGSNKAIEQASINTNNNASKLDQAKNKAKEYAIELGQKLQPAFASIVSKGALMMKSLSNIVDILIKYKDVVIPLTTAIIAYAAAVKIQAMLEKINASNTILATIAKKAYNGIITVLRLNLKKATIEQEALNKAGKANVWGLVAAGVTAAATYLISYVNKMREAGKVSKQIADATKETSSEFGKQRAELEQLLVIARDHNRSLSDRQAAIKQINAISPEYLGNITLENINTQQTTASINKYIEALQLKAREQAISNLSSEKYAKIMELEVKSSKEYWDSQSSTWRYMQGTYTQYSNKLIDEKNKLLAEIEDLNKMFEKISVPVTKVSADVTKKITDIENAWATAGDAVNKTLEERTKALDLLNTYLSGHVDTLTLENINWSANADAIRAYIDQLKYAGDAAQTPVGTQKEINGVMCEWDGSNWKPVQVSNTSTGSGSGTPAEEKKNDLDREIWEMAQFEESMLIDQGQFYAEYITQRKSADQSYWSWKKENDKKEAEKNKKLFLESLEISKQEQLNLLLEQYAQGKIDAAEYEAGKQQIIYASLENELAIRKSFGEETLTLEQQVFEQRMELERRSFEQRKKMIENIQSKRKEDLEKEKAELKQKYELYLSVASEMGETVGKIMGDTSKTAQERFKEVAKQLLLITLKTLKNQLTASIASATLQSISSAESVASWGIAGVAKATLLTAALEGAYAFAASRLEGYSSGGPTGGSDPTRVAGLVHEKEYVIPEEGVQNPAIAKILTVIESARQSNKLSSLNWDTLFQMPGLISGGHTSTNRVNPSARVSRLASSLPHSTDPQLIAVLSLLSNKLEKLDEIEAKIFYDKQKISDSRITNSFNKSRLSD